MTAKQTDLTISEGDVGQGVQQSKGLPMAQEYLRLRLMYPKWAKAKCARMAGYSKNVSTTQVEKTVSKWIAGRNIDEQRKALGIIPGFTFTDNIAALNAIGHGVTLDAEGNAEDIDVPASVRVQALSKVAGLMSYEPSTKVEVTQRSLIMEFNNLSSEDLALVAKAYQSGDISDTFTDTEEEV